MPVDLAGPGERGPFLTLFLFIQPNDPERGDGLHSNTTTIKPYPDKVLSDPITGKLHFPEVGSQSPFSDHELLRFLIYG